MKFFFCVRTVEHPPEELVEVAPKTENPIDISPNGLSEPTTTLAEKTVIPSAPVAIQIQLPEATTAETATSVKPDIPVGSPMTTSIISNENNSSVVKPNAENTSPDAAVTNVVNSEKANENVKTSNQNLIKCDADLKANIVGEPRVENIKLKIDHSKQNKVSIVKNKNEEENRKINNGVAKKSESTKELKARLKKEQKQSKETKMQDKNLKLNEKVGAENETKQNSSAPKKADSVSILNIKEERNRSPPCVQGTAKEEKEPSPEKVCAKSDMKVEPQGEEADEKKSEFLNSFHLTPRKSLSPEKNSVKEEPDNDAKPVKKPSPDKTEIAKDKAQKVNLLTTKLVANTISSYLNQKTERAQNAKGSKRKSREPIKNIVKKSRSESPCMQRISDNILKPIKSKTPPLLPKDAPTISFALSPFPIGTSAAKSTLPSMKTLSPPLPIAPKIKEPATQSNPPPLKILDFWSPKESVDKSDTAQGNKPNSPGSKPIYNGPFKVPTLPVKDSPVKKAAKQTDGPPRKAATAKKPIIVNNVQRPNQADTPRPTLKARGTTTKLTPILPKLAPAAPKPSLIAPKGGIRLGSGTEIKEIKNDGRRNDIKVYGPSPDMPYGSCSPAYVPSYPSPTILNYALMNSGAPISSRPDLHFGSFYPPKASVYSPASPKYPLKPAPTPPANIPNTLENKYQKPLLFTSSSNPIAPKPTSPVTTAAGKVDLKAATNNGKTKPSSNTTKTVESSKKINDATKPASPEKTPFKRTLAEAIESVTKPGDNEQKVQSLLNSCNINFPSSLSITLTNEENDPTSSNPLYNPKHKSPVNNYIEIVKLPDIPAEDANKTSRGTTTSPRPANGIHVTSKSADIKAIVNELNSKATEAKRQSVSPPFTSNGSSSPPIANYSTAKTPLLPNSISISEITVSPTSQSPPAPRLSPIKGAMVKTSVSPTYRTPVSSPTKTPVSPPIITNKIPAETFQAKFLQSILEKKENELKSIKKQPSPPHSQSNGSLPAVTSVPKVGRPRKNNSPSDGAPPKKKERKNSSENKLIKSMSKPARQPSALDLSVSMPALSPFSSPSSSKQLQALANNNDLPSGIASSINVSAALFMDAMARSRDPSMMPAFLPMGLNQAAASLWVQQLMMQKAKQEAYLERLKKLNQNEDGV